MPWYRVDGALWYVWAAQAFEQRRPRHVRISRHPQRRRGVEEDRNSQSAESERTIGSRKLTVPLGRSILRAATFRTLSMFWVFVGCLLFGWTAFAQQATAQRPVISELATEDKDRVAASESQIYWGRLIGRGRKPLVDRCTSKNSIHQSLYFALLCTRLSNPGNPGRPPTTGQVSRKSTAREVRSR